MIFFITCSRFQGTGLRMMKKAGKMLSFSFNEFDLRGRKKLCKNTKWSVF